MDKEKLKRIPGVLPLYHYLYKLAHPQWLMTYQVFRYNKKRFKRYSGAFRTSKGRDLAYLTWFYHQIEKGLAMRDMRLGFGVEKIIRLNQTIDKYVSKYGATDTQLRDAIAVMFEYQHVHEEAGYQLPTNILAILDKKRKQYPDIPKLVQQGSTSNTYFSNIHADFNLFSKSRHSIRNFSGAISIQQIIDAIDLARNAPSACNRQPSRVHIITQQKQIEACLALQNGNRGFGYLADKLLVVTGDLSTVLGAQEFFDLNTNVGIFIMNLSYALHYHKVAHCILNWYVLPKADKKLRQILELPENETVICFIVCGSLPKEFKIVSSPRITAEDIYMLH